MLNNCTCKGSKLPYIYNLKLSGSDVLQVKTLSKKCCYSRTPLLLPYLCSWQIRGEFVFGIGSKFELDLKLHGVSTINLKITWFVCWSSLLFFQPRKHLCLKHLINNYLHWHSSFSIFRGHITLIWPVYWLSVHSGVLLLKITFSCPIGQT